MQYNVIAPIISFVGQIFVGRWKKSNFTSINMNKLCYYKIKKPCTLIIHKVEVSLTENAKAKS